MKALTIRLAAGVLAGGLVAATPLAAFADGSTTTVAGSATTQQPSKPKCTQATFSTAQQFVEGQLNNRVGALNNLSTRVKNAKGLTSADSATLTGDLSGQQSGIGALVSKVPTDTTCAQLGPDAHSMVFTYRVYVVMTPQTDLTVVADTGAGIANSLANDEAAIQSAINNAPPGANVSGAQAAFNDLKAQVSGAQGALNGVSANVLAQTPAGYPGNATVFQGARTSVSSAKTDLHAAVGDLSTILKDLK